MATRDYGSINAIKKFAMEELAPKYFNMEETNDLNIGLLGYTTELIANTVEDSFNTATTFMNEMFPNLAIMPETIYNNGALFQVDGAFATASECEMLLFIPEDQITKYAVKVANSSDLFEFYLDSNMTISVEDIRFKPDYDIRILYSSKRGLYTAEYNMVENGAAYKNSISNITNSNINLKRIVFENNKYLQLEIKTHQVDRYEMNDNIVDSTIINLPKYIIEYDGYIAGFEVFYKAPNSNSYSQLEKRMLGTSPSKLPFCYYKNIDENKIEISFTSRDNYFQPEYNSEINIRYFTTSGDKGNFLEYTGTKITVVTSSEVYDYNNNIMMFVIPVSGAYGGTSPMSLEELKNITIEKFSTVDSYTTENDLQLYFDNFNTTFNSYISFIKKRDDVFERLFSAYVLLRDESNEIYSTNTLKVAMRTEDFDDEQEQGDIFILKPGRLFKYKPGLLDMAEIYPPNITARDHASIHGIDFLYSNPFLMYYSKSPVSVGYYLTTFDNKYIVDYGAGDNDTNMHFICNSLKIKRDGIGGSDKYKVTLTLSPTTELDNPMVTEVTDQITGITTSTINNTISVKLIVTNGESDICYLNMNLESWDLDLDVYTFGCEIVTNDEILDNNRFIVLGMLDIETDEPTPNRKHHVPMTDCVLRIEVNYTNAENDESPSVTRLANRYYTKTNPVTFIRPVKMMRSTSKYNYNKDGVMQADGSIVGGTYTVNIDSVPLIEASVLSDSSKYLTMYNTLVSQYNYIENIIDLITNNFAIDIKFYNTYGKSKNFYAADANTARLDKVNISIGFKVRPVFGTNEDELVRDIKYFIKDYIENINNGGTNTFYVSNLIKELENNFDSIEYLKFTGINNYTTDTQAIINNTVDLNTLTKTDRIDYVPEYLTVNLDSINIEIF